MSDAGGNGAAVNTQQSINKPDDNHEPTKQEKHEAAAVDEINKQSKRSGDLTMHVRVSAPFREYFDGQAFSLSAANLTGPFDILPKHHSFISLLTRCEVVIRGLVDGEQKVVKILISGGIIHVKADEVLVFLDV